MRILLSILGIIFGISLVIFIFMMVFRICPSAGFASSLPWCIPQEIIIPTEQIKDSLSGKIDFDKVDGVKDMVNGDGVTNKIKDFLSQWLTKKINQ